MPTPKEEELRRREDLLVEELMVLFGQEREEIERRIQEGEIDLDDFWREREGTSSSSADDYVIAVREGLMPSRPSRKVPLLTEILQTPSFYNEIRTSSPTTDTLYCRTR